MSELYIALYCTRTHSRILLISKNRDVRDFSMCKYQNAKPIHHLHHCNYLTALKRRNMFVTIKKLIEFCSEEDHM